MILTVSVPGLGALLRNVVIAFLTLMYEIRMGWNSFGVFWGGIDCLHNAGRDKNRFFI